MKLKLLLQSKLNENDEVTNLDEYETWYDCIDDIQYYIEKDTILKLVNKYDLNYKSYLNNVIFKLYDNKKTRYLEYDKENETFDFISDIYDWVYSVRENDLPTIGLEPTSLYNAWAEGSIETLSKNPGIVYHYTMSETYDEFIKPSGVLKGNYGSGLTNRYIHGIFTSVDPEIYADGTYGDLCLKINLDLFLKESGLTELNLEFEPDVYEYLIKNYIFSELEIEDTSEIPSDMSPYTVIVGHVIPLKYIEIIK
jgi:hypothetical protein